MAVQVYKDEDDEGAGAFWRDTAVILGLWLSVVIPMTVLAWGVAPRLMQPDDPLKGLTFWTLIVVGMAWQMVVSILVLRCEGVALTWPSLKDRLWLGAPIWRPTGQKVWIALLVIPVFVVIGLIGDEGVTHLFDQSALAQTLRAITPSYAMIENLDQPAAFGRWDILGLVLVSSLFNYILGEAFFFHGILLPRMEKAWGRWAWLGNGLLFTGYHVHKFWMLPGLLISCLCYSLPSQIFRSNWFALVIHGIEGLFLVVAVLMVIT
ncbi:CPBP family glutamic-type intramembrane protease [Woodsholea maritima]|uniref:CPBP family glutamic-type intramembrane protease n=1 Tax=Woodsholea maritima TaxID=240237 RepID=UPI000382DDA6|nr:CPBP family glutamic-type intramembrane protease [Woodsholea maritima]